MKKLSIITIGLLFLCLTSSLSVFSQTIIYLGIENGRVGFLIKNDSQVDTLYYEWIVVQDDLLAIESDTCLIPPNEEITIRVKVDTSQVNAEYDILVDEVLNQNDNNDGSEITNIDFSVYPNPMTTGVYVSYPNERPEEGVQPLVWNLFSIDGMLIASGEATFLGGSVFLDFQTLNLRQGAYFLQLNFGSENKLIKIFKY